MDKKLYEFIVKKEHYKFRHTVDWNLAEEYSVKQLSAIERMADRFQRLCEEETAVILENEQIVFLRTVSNLPAIFTDSEWDEIKSKHYIHELGFMSNLSPNYYGHDFCRIAEKKRNCRCLRKKGDRQYNQTIRQIFRRSPKAGQRRFG